MREQKLLFIYRVLWEEKEVREDAKHYWRYICENLGIADHKLTNREINVFLEWLRAQVYKITSFCDGDAEIYDVMIESLLDCDDDDEED